MAAEGKIKVLYSRSCKVESILIDKFQQKLVGNAVQKDECDDDKIVRFCMISYLITIASILFITSQNTYLQNTTPDHKNLLTINHASSRHDYFYKNNIPYI